jgi:hypothetical protein
MIKSLLTSRSVVLGLMLSALVAVPAEARNDAAPGQAHAAAAPGHSAGNVSPAHASGNVSSAYATGPSSLSSLAAVDTSMCAQLAFSQPFAAFGDYGYYTLMPGQSVDNFAGTGWAFSGGAGLLSVKLHDGSTGQVLNLPGGASAISPLMCVSSNYPTGRTMIRNVRGVSGVQFYVSYQGSRTWTKPRNTGLVHGWGTAWTLSHTFSLQPNRTTVGWQIVRFRLSVPRRGGDYQLYNVYVDPHMLR